MKAIDITKGKSKTIILLVVLCVVCLFNGPAAHAFLDRWSDEEIQFIDPTACDPTGGLASGTAPATDNTSPTPSTPTADGAVNPCGGCDTGSSVSSLSGKDNVEKTVNFFMQQGLSPAQAAGVAANFMWETGGGQTIDPLIAGPTPSGGAWGIAQWTPPSTYVNAKQQAGIQGEDKDLLTQLKVVWYEMQGKGGRQSTNIIPGLKKITNAGDAADYFRANFERCDTSNASCTTNRVDTANNLVKDLGDGSVGGGNSSTCVSGTADSGGDVNIGGTGNTGSIGTITGQKGDVGALIQLAKALSNTKISYVWGGSHGPGQIKTTDPDTLRKQGMDCSSSVSWVLYQAGLLGSSGDALTTAGLASWGDAGKGKEVTVWVKNNGTSDDHTFIEFNVPGVGHYRLDTSQHSGSGPRLVPWGTRNTNGFEPRHWAGT